MKGLIAFILLMAVLAPAGAWADSIAQSGQAVSSIPAAAGSTFTVTLSSTRSAANMRLVVDVSTRATGATWYGKGFVDIAASGTSVQTVTVTVANTIPSGASVMLKAWLLPQSRVNDAQPWLAQTAELQINVAVDSGSGGGGGDGGGGDGTTPAPPSSSSYPTSAAVGKYAYATALDYSLRFYEGQRSGRLPPSNRIPYRGNSCLADGSDLALDLSGGWFDAGDHVKFNFPMAYSAHMLAWGVWQYRDAYAAAGQLEQALAQIRWVTDYLIASHPSPEVFVAQVGSGGADHAFWGRPEDLTMARPSYTINAANPGSDLAAAASAALSSMAVIYRSTDAAYANSCLSHAQTLYTFAKNRLGIYSQSVPDAASFYASSGYQDDLTLAAVWLHIATSTGPAGSSTPYLAEAESRWAAQGVGNSIWSLSWDSVGPAATTLLWLQTGKPAYAASVESFVNQYMPGGSVTRTPKGLAWRDQWGSLRYASGAALVAFVYGDSVYTTKSALSQQYHDFAVSQMHYALGDTGRSYLTGFGTNPPAQPHHRAASCPNRPASCTDAQLYASGPNPQLLYGALVGGPGSDDSYVDSRTDYTKNEVTTDYNAAFTSALARLVMEVQGPSTPGGGPDGVDSGSTGNNNAPQVPSSSSSTGSSGSTPVPDTDDDGPIGPSDGTASDGTASDGAAASSSSSTGAADDSEGTDDNDAGISAAHSTHAQAVGATGVAAIMLLLAHAAM